MSKLILTIFFAFVLTRGSQGAGIQPAIIGGDAPGLTFAPYLVSIQNSTFDHLCSGTLLSTRWVLTSATCAKLDISFLVTGLVTLDTGDVPDYLNTIESKFPNPNYRVGYNDIALIKTKQPVLLTDTIQAISITYYDIGAGTTMNIAGWNDSDPTILSVQSITNEQCKKDVDAKSVVVETNLCAVRSAGKGTCVGDSGLAAVSSGYVQAVVSLSPAVATNCAKGVPEIYTRVFSYYNWIYNTMYYK